MATQEHKESKSSSSNPAHRIYDTPAKPERRQGALLALGILGPKVPGVVVGISAGLADSDIGVRRRAAQILGEMGAGAKGTVDALAKAVKSDKEASVRESAARALGRIGPDAKSAVSILGDALQDQHAGTRAAAFA